MDKKNIIIGALLFALGFGLIMWQDVQQEQRKAQYLRDHPELAVQATAAGNQTAAVAPGNATVTKSPAVANAQAPTPSAAPAPTTPAATYIISNDNITVTLTEAGGAVQTVALKNFPTGRNDPSPVMFNAGAPESALALEVPQAVPAGPNPPDVTPPTYWMLKGSSSVSVYGDPGMPPAPLVQRYILDKTASTRARAVFRGQTPDGLEITRTYSLDGSDPYIVRNQTSLTNHSAASVSLTRIFVSTGAPPPTPGAGAIATYNLNFGYYDGASATFVPVSQFMDNPGMLFGLIGARPKMRDWVYAARENGADLHWVSVKDQFFAAVLTPDRFAGSGIYLEGANITMNGTAQTTVAGAMELNLGVLPKGQTTDLDLSYYVGPKEYVRLDELGQHQDLVMQMGWFGTVSEILLLVLIALHNLVVNISPQWAWGWSILIFTAIMKLLTWPLTAMQVRSARRMQQFQKPLAALKEKYKDNPQKLQTETLELFKKHKINPAAGCLPLLISVPIFIAFNYMLRTASEFRLAPFFWISDLAMPDTVGHIFGFPINILPFLMTACTMLQMRLMPAPTTDSTQRTMMQFMPLMMLFILYTMPAGMMLYWTCQNLFTIIQQAVTRRQADAAGPAIAPASPLPKRR
jgi:YidC/Oxa1 family membrane protein insertase